MPYFVIGILAMVCAAPVFATWGWVRIFRRGRPTGPVQTASTAALVLATASLLLAVAAPVYGTAIGGYVAYAHSLLGFIGAGLLLSCIAVLCGLVGVWRRSSIQWFAVIAAAGTLALWLIAVAAA